MNRSRGPWVWISSLTRRTDFDHRMRDSEPVGESLQAFLFVGLQHQKLQRGHELHVEHRNSEIVGVAEAAWRLRGGSATP